MNTLWYCLSVLFVLVAILVTFRLIVRRDYKNKGKLGGVAALSQWILILLWVVFSSFYIARDWPAIHVGIITQYIGWLLIGIGLPFFLFSLFRLGLGPAHGINTELLLTSGPYRYSRNPQIVGFLTAMIGYTLLWSSWHSFVSLVLVIILSHTMVITEEEHLLRKFGDDYQHYCKQVGRYIRIGLF